MLILCYGVTKSGSTLAFELVKGMLETAGHPQVRLPDGPVQAGQIVNYIEPVDRRTLRRLLAAIGDRWIAVKTHWPMSDETFLHLEQLLRKDRLRVIASCRDPRELCLSLMDAGAQARAQGLKEFAEFTDMEITSRVVRRRLGHFQKWGALRGALRLDYDVVAFSPDRAMELIEQYLGICSDRNQAKHYAFETAFTQKNRAKRHRALEEYSHEQYEALTAKFSDILKALEDESSYAAIRKHVLAHARRQLQKANRKENDLDTKPASTS